MSKRNGNAAVADRPGFAGDPSAWREAIADESVPAEDSGPPLTDFIERGMAAQRAVDGATAAWPILDDFTHLEEIAGRDTDRRSMECAHNLETRLNVRTYGELRRSEAARFENDVWVVKPISGISASQARALSDAIKKAASARPTTAATSPNSEIPEKRNSLPAPASEPRYDPAVPLHQITPSKTNPRTVFDEAKLAELAESMRGGKGVLEPLLVRPLPSGSEWPLNAVIDQAGLSSPGLFNSLTARGLDRVEDVLERAKQYKGPLVDQDEKDKQLCRITGALNSVPGVSKLEAQRLAKAIVRVSAQSEGLELVAGERRYRAAKLAGLITVPALIRPMSDLEALEIQVIENEQREDLTPLQKADGYARLVEQHQVAIDDLAARVGKSPSSIRGLLKLRNLPELARQAVESGHLPQSTALLIARIPSAECRERYAHQVLAGDDFYGEPTAIVARKRMEEGVAPLTYRDAKELAELHYMIELKQAAFSRKSLDLVPEAGSCDACPKRAGNNPAEWPGVRADVCTDPACFRAKSVAHGRQLAAANGTKLIEGKAAEKLFHGHGGLRYDAPYVDVNEKTWAGSDRKTWKAIVGDELAGQEVAAIDADGRVRILVPKAAATKLLEAKSKTKSKEKSSPANDPWARQQRERDRKAKLGKEAARRANGMVALKVQTVAAFHDWNKPLVDLLRVMVAAMADEMWSDACKQVVKRRDAGKDTPGQRDSVKDLVDACQGADAGPQILGLLAELVSARKSLFWGSTYGTTHMDREEKEFWAAFGVDRAKLTKQVEAEAKAKAKPKKKARGKA